MTALLCLSFDQLSAQSDKEIIKAANLDIKNKDYELAFKKIITVSKPEQKKPQDILEKTYPYVIAGNFTKANAIKLSEKDNDQVTIEKLGQIISYLQDNCTVDSLFKKAAEPALYKSLSKKKKNESTLATFKARLKTINEARIKQEQLKFTADSLRADSIAKAIQAADTLKKTATSTSDSAISKNITSSTTLVNGENTAVSGDKKYYIIAGSYKTQVEAQAAVSKLKASGYASEIVGANAYGNLRICYSGFNDKTEALKELEKIKGNVQVDAWLLEK